jgi:hypothetical protein
LKIHPESYDNLDEKAETDLCFRPGKIDNRDLLEEKSHTSLRPNLIERQDFVIVSEKLWILLASWYGGGPAIQRQSIRSGSKSDVVMVELYPLTFRCRVKGSIIPIEVHMSRNSTVAYLVEKICHLSANKLSPSDVQLWDVFDKKLPTRLSSLSETIEDCKLVNCQEIYVDVKMSNGQFAGFSSRLDVSQSDGEDDLESPNSDTDDEIAGAQVSSLDLSKRSKGICGLFNLGNTYVYF